MNEFQLFLKNLDVSKYDCISDHIIIDKLKDFAKTKEKDPLFDLRLISLEIEAFSIRKSFDIKADKENGKLKGLSYRQAGSRITDKGIEESFYWPDVRSLTKDDFLYFEKRFKESNSLYFRTEYGLLVYFGERTDYSKHLDFKKELFHDLMKLVKDYYSKALLPNKENHYVLHFYSILKTAFTLASKSRLKQELDDIIEFIYQTHQEWDLGIGGTLRVLIDLTECILDNFKYFKSKFDFESVIVKNLEGAKRIQENHTWGAIHLVDKNIILCNKISKNTDSLVKYKAELFEMLSVDYEKNNSMACVSFCEDALRLYKELKDSANITRLESRYTELRGKFELTQNIMELPKEYSEQMQKNISLTLSDSTNEQILEHFIITPWYDTLENIKSSAVEGKKQSVLLSRIGTSIHDKFGNTIDKFNTDDEIDKYLFWQTFGFDFQIGTQTMHKFFVQAYQLGKINYSTTINYLEKTWFNDVIVREYHGEHVEVKPLDLIRPGIKKFFEELDSFFSKNSDEFELVLLTDSLVLKIESLIRFFCEKIGVPTFKPRKKRDKGAAKIVMEKILDDMLGDLKVREDSPNGLNERDRMYIKYVMTEKVGLNLRNEIAHGLLDYEEYSFSHLLVIFSILMKLSKYKFTPII